MGISDKLAAQASTKLGEPVVAAAMIVPPGATLYKAYSPKSEAAGAGGPIVEALLSKPQGSLDGDAGTVPTAQGVLALTADSAVYLKKKKLGVGVGEPVTEWPRSSVTFAYADRPLFSDSKGE